MRLSIFHRVSVSHVLLPVPSKLSGPFRAQNPMRVFSALQIEATEVVEAFYSDLEAAKPLDSLPVVHCAKSVSFDGVLNGGKVSVGMSMV